MRTLARFIQGYMKIIISCINLLYLLFLLSSYINLNSEGSLRGIAANVLDCDIVVSEFELQLRY